MSTGDSSFWDYSLTIYGQPAVAQACLSLQNQYGFDVNLVLFCLWYGGNFPGTMPQALLTAALERSRHWSEVAVRPLRKIRTEIKQDEQLQELSEGNAINALREEVKSLELQAEKIQQNLLQELAYSYREDNPAPQADDARISNAENGHQNLLRLTAAMQIDPDGELESLFTVLLTALLTVLPQRRPEESSKEST